MAKEITIIVAAKTGQGKSTIAKVISNALKANGIKARVFDDEKSYPEPQEQYDQKVKAIAAKSEVIIKTVNVNRSLEPTSSLTGL